jgi:septal ring factor EnvC (AmiA/AmiB activator)
MIIVGSNLNQVIPAMPPSVEKYESQRENLNKLKIKVLQLRNRLGRQKRIRGLNERSLKAGKKRADKVEGLLIEMQTDLISLKGRLQEELDELGELLSSFSMYISYADVCVIPFKSNLLLLC